MHKRNIRFVVTYDGTRYLGWQRLGGDKRELSIQGLLERCISDVVEENIRIHGSGRTDAGVHAFAQVANYSTISSKSCKDIMAECNAKLPEDIVIKKMEEVEKSFHSRYSAVSKVYEYYIDMGEREDVFHRKYAYHIGKQLDIESMREAARYLVGTHDFTSFSTDRVKEKSNKKESLKRNSNGESRVNRIDDPSSDTIRTLYDIDIQVVSSILTIPNDEVQGLVRIQLHGDGFLYNMVRIIVGSLLEVGLKEKTPIAIKEALTMKNRQYAGVTAPSNGLFLREVEY